MIYFAQVEIARFRFFFRPTRTAYYIKIGCSIQPKARVNQLQNEYGMPVELLGVMPGDFDEESRIHQRFDHLRIPEGRERNGQGLELFFPTEELREFIRKLPELF